MRVLVTGAAGFVGANLVRALLRDGHEVVAWRRPGGDAWRLEPVRGDIVLSDVDLRDPDALSAAVSKARPEWIFHLAAHGAYSWQSDDEQIMQTNLVATVRLLAACRALGFAAFVHAGSSSEYGAKDHAPGEREFVEPNSAYAVMKAAATLHCRFVAQHHALHIVTLRLYSVYGPWEEPGRLMPTLVGRGMEGSLPALVSPDTPRDFITARDAVRAFLLAAERTDAPRGSVFNIGSGVQTTLRSVVQIARSQLGIEPQPQWGTASQRRWDTETWVADPTSARRALGWIAGDDVPTGFGCLVDWMRSHEELWPRYGIGPVA